MLHHEKDLDCIEIIDKHLEQFFYEDEVLVFHEKETKEDSNHMDVFWITSNKYPDFNILMTCGMSRYEMSIPENSKGNKLIEVVILLPKSWNLKGLDWQDEEKCWPILHLKSIGKIPFEQNTWIESSHTISYDKNRGCMPGTNFVGSIILPPLSLEKEFTIIEAANIHFLMVLPIFEEELTYKLKHGSNKLIDKLNRYGINDVLDINRRNTCKPRFKFW